MATTLDEPLKRACLPVIPGLASWASLVDSTHGLKVWQVKGSPPGALNPQYPELLAACVNDQNFRAIVDGRLKNRKGESTCLPDRIRDEAAKQLFAPHCVKTPGLVLFISHNDSSAKTQVFSERLPATTVYHCYRYYIEYYSYAPNRPKDTEYENRRIAALMTYNDTLAAALKNLRSHARQIYRRTRIISTAMVEQFAQVSWDYTCSVLLATELLIVELLGISPECAKMAELLTVVGQTPPTVAELSPTERRMVSEETQAMMNHDPSAHRGAYANLERSEALAQSFPVHQDLLADHLACIIEADKEDEKSMKD